jgi:hypothetical protein
MERLLSHCGLLCGECGAYLATRSDDDAKRAEVAREWSRMYGAALDPADINCDGCVSDGPRLFHHATVCEIRRCARARGAPNCGHCDEYACERLEGLFAMVPEARVRLDEVRAAR